MRLLAGILALDANFPTLYFVKKYLSKILKKKVGNKAPRKL